MRRSLAVLGVTVLVSWAPASRAEAPEAEACFEAGEHAQPLLKDRKLRAAARELAICAREACPRAVRTDCRTWLEQLAQVLPTVVFRARESRPGGDVAVNDVRVWVDGEVLVPQLIDDNPVPIDPGYRLLRFEHAGFPTVEQRIDLREGESRRVVDVVFRSAEAPPAASSPPVREPPAPRPTSSSSARTTSTSRPAPIRPARSEDDDAPVPASAWGLFGASAIALGVGAYFEAAGLSSRSHLADTCGVTRSCPPSDVDASHNQVRAGDVGLGVGAALLIGAAYIYFTRGPADASHRSASLHVGLGPVAGGLVGALGGNL